MKEAFGSKCWVLLLLCYFCWPEMVVGALERVPNSSIKIPITPPATNYVVERLAGWPPIWPVGFLSLPGETNRFFTIYQPGAIVVVPDLTAPKYELFLDLTDKVAWGGELGMLGLAFHPGYKSNGWFYVFYTTTATGPDGSPIYYDNLSRFQVNLQDPNHALRNSEQKMISQLDENGSHNAGDLHFGPDGYLYVSLGDEGGGFNNFWNAGRVDKDLFSGILRLDVDNRPGSLEPNPHPAVFPGTYRIPPDNPFIGATNYIHAESIAFPELDPAKVRTEFYAIGFRNPWRFSIDQQTGELYVNDVGQNEMEEIDLVTKGGHYGWPYLEGSLPTYWPPPPEGVIGPIYEYPHTDGRVAITGSMIYRGTVYPELDGAYIFTDLSGWIGALRRDAGGAITTKWIGYYPGSIWSIGLHPTTGEIMILDGTSGYLAVLKRRVTEGPPIPQKLSETGLFKDTKTLTPENGVVPYDVNVSFWSDNAMKQRWFVLPGTNTTINFSATNTWQFPVGSMWVKQFDLETEPGVPASRRRVSSRILVRQSGGVYGLTYRWDENGEDATLVDASGQDEDFLIKEDGTNRVQKWHYPGRFECAACHTPVAGYVLGFNTAQLNRTVDYGDGEESQLHALSRAGYFTTPLTVTNTLPRLAALDDEHASREYRLRSYLAANCSQCHQPNGTTRTFWDARLAVPLDSANIINAPLVNQFDSAEARVIVPGNLTNSIMYRRLNEIASYHMPPLATYEINQDAVDLLRDWIMDDLPNRQTYADWQNESFDNPESADAQENADFDHDGLVNELEFLLHTSPTDPASDWRVSIESDGNDLHLSYPRLPNVKFDLQWTSNPSDPGSWASLDVPENEPVIVQEESLVEVAIKPESRQRFFRVLISRP